MFKLQFWLITRQILFFYRRRDFARILVASLFLLILLALIVASYISGRIFIAYMSSFSQFSYPFLRFTLLSLVSALSLLSLISFTIAYFKTLFDKNLTTFFLLFSSQGIAFSVFIITLIVGSWPFLLISLPFFFGLSRLRPAFPLFPLLVIVFHLLLSIILASISGILALGLYKLFGKRLVRLLPLFLLVFLFGFFIIFTRLIFPSDLTDISSLDTSFLSLSFFPTSLFVRGILGEGQTLWWLFVQSLLSVVFFLFFAGKIYRQSWQAYSEGCLLAGSGAKIQRASLQFPPSMLCQTSVSPFILNEWLYLRRTISAFFYLAFIVLLCALFVFFLSKTRNLSGEYIRFTDWVTAAAFFSVSYLILLFVIRFVFPIFALESPFIWLAVTAFSIRQKLSRAKWLFSYLSVLIFVTILGITTFTLGGLTVSNPLSIILLAVSYVLLVTGIALAIGQVAQRELPKDDVEAISTTVPGIFLTVVSLILGVVLALIIFSRSAYFISVFILALTVIFVILVHRYSLWHYDRSDIG